MISTRDNSGTRARRPRCLHWEDKHKIEGERIWFMATREIWHEILIQASANDV